MRVLVVSHPPLLPELGAAQIALSLARGLELEGHEVRSWSAAPVGENERSLAQSGDGQRRLEELIAADGPFDVIDAPADLIGDGVRGAGFVVARSVQPELEYRWVELLEQLRRNPLSPHLFLNALRSARTVARIRRGWRRSSLVLCLGTTEKRWMERRYPGLRRVLASYRIAPPPADREVFRGVRGRRSAGGVGAAGRRFLWLGRWSAHKGTRHLTSFLRGLREGDRVTVAGCGSDGVHQLSSLGLSEDRLEIVPRFQRSELGGLLERHDSGLFTSLAEGWGLGLQEMLESGLPVFATRAGCVTDLEPYFGSRISPFPPPAQGPEPHALGQVDWMRYEKAFNWQAIAREYIVLVDSMRRGSGP